jgi:acetylglutamate kinase
MQLSLKHREKIITAKTGNLTSATPLTTSATQVKRYTDYEEMGGEERVRAILEESFGKKVAPNFFDTKPIAVFLAKEDGEAVGIAIIKTIQSNGIEYPYLDKIGVLPKAAGKKIGSKIMAKIKEDFKALSWRATNENPANNWYKAISDYSKTGDKWTVYTYGIDGEKEALVQKIDSLEASMIK